MSVSAPVPASRDSVFGRADEFFRVEGYTVVERRVGSELAGYKTVSREGNVETRSFLRFEITRSNPDETTFRVEGRTQTGVPPAMSTLDSMGREASLDMQRLQSRLMCPAARWPRCP